MDVENEMRRKAEDKAHSCPYAKVLMGDSSKPHDASEYSSLPGLAELKACPAFSNKECPFKGLATNEVAEKLKEIPPSHLEANGTFHKTLEFFHQHAPKETLECPVKHTLPPDFSFDQAMEEFSLASIMGSLAREYETLDKGRDDSSSDDEDLSTKSAAEISPPPAASRTSLSQALKNGTAIAHEAAESVHFVKNFIRGKIDRNLYALLVAQLFHVYTKLEDALDEQAPVHFAQCHYPKELRRTQALQEDVDFWHTTSRPPISEATQDYLDRLEYLSKNKPLLLLSHAYTRYLGDLSGGKVLARVARRALDLSKDDAGLAFYHFEHVKSFKLFKDQYRVSLNALELKDDQINDLVQEANVAFLLNMRLFEELDVLDNIPGATVRSLKDVYHLSKQPASTKAGDASQCPFIAKQNDTASAMGAASVAVKKHGVCPWPFILLHDPATGMKKWQTWLVIGLVLAVVYQNVV
jgi:heme oxygenase